MPFFSAYSSCRWSARNRLWQDWHSVSGSVNVATWPRGLPGLARQDHRGVEADDVVAGLHHRAPPLALDVLLQLDAERAVVPGRPGAAVDLAAGEDEPPALGEGDDVVDGRRGAAWPREAAPAVGCAGWLTAKRQTIGGRQPQLARHLARSVGAARLDELVGRRLVDGPATAGARRSASRRTPRAPGGSCRRSAQRGGEHPQVRVVDVAADRARRRTPAARPAPRARRARSARNASASPSSTRNLFTTSSSPARP